MQCNVLQMTSVNGETNYEKYNNIYLSRHAQHNQNSILRHSVDIMYNLLGERHIFH